MYSYVCTFICFNRTFISNYGPSIDVLSGDADGSSLSWRVNLAEEVLACYAEQVHLLIDTGKQMDTALQRRSKIRHAPNSSSGTAAMSDYEKIALQIQLDVDTFGVAVLRFLQIDSGPVNMTHTALSDFQSFVAMKTEIAESVASASSVAN